MLRVTIIFILAYTPSLLCKHTERCFLEDPVFPVHVGGQCQVLTSWNTVQSQVVAGDSPAGTGVQFVQFCREMCVLMARQSWFWKAWQRARAALPLGSVSGDVSADTGSPFSPVLCYSPYTEHGDSSWLLSWGWEHSNIISSLILLCCPVSFPIHLRFVSYAPA